MPSPPQRRHHRFGWAKPGTPTAPTWARRSDRRPPTRGRRRGRRGHVTAVEGSVARGRGPSAALLWARLTHSADVRRPDWRLTCTSDYFRMFRTRSIAASSTDERGRLPDASAASRSRQHAHQRSHMDNRFGSKSTHRRGARRGFRSLRLAVTVIMCAGALSVSEGLLVLASRET